MWPGRLANIYCVGQFITGQSDVCFNTLNNHAESVRLSIDYQCGYDTGKFPFLKNNFCVGPDRTQWYSIVM